MYYVKFVYTCLSSRQLDKLAEVYREELRRNANVRHQSRVQFNKSVPQLRVQALMKPVQCEYRILSLFLNLFTVNFWWRVLARMYTYMHVLLF